MRRREAADAEAHVVAARQAAETARRLAEAARLWTASRPRAPANGSPKQYLVLGAAPHEGRRGRTHYNNPNVWLLGHEPPREGGHNYSRYIQADYGVEYAEELRAIAEAHPGKFDEISFDESSMCAIFSSGRDSLAHRFRSFYIMLKESGVFYLPDSNEEMEEALQTVGFETIKIRVRDLGGDTLINILGLRPDDVVLVGIKGARAPRRMARGAPAPAPGGKRLTRRRRYVKPRGNSIRNRNRRSRF